MRIAFLSPAAELGGAERCLLDILASFRENKPDVELLLASSAEGPLIHRARALGVETAVLPMPTALLSLGDSAFREGRWRSRASAVARLAPAAVMALGHTHDLGRLLRAWGPDVVHSNGMKHHLLGALARRGGAPIVWHVRDLVGSRPLMARALACASVRAAGAIAISGMVADDVRRRLPRLPVATVHDAIDIEEFSPGPGDSARLDRLAGLPPAGDGTVRLGLVATYGRWKGQDIFLDAAARVCQRLPRGRSRFYVVGGPIYRTRGSQFSESELRQRAARLGLGEAVGFVSFQAEPAEVMRALDVVVHASTQPEPFGRTIAEAMACGRPVIAGQSGALELFPRGTDSPVVAAGDVDALATAMERLILDPGLRHRLGQLGRTTAVDRFSRETLASDVLAAYSRIGLTWPRATG